LPPRLRLLVTKIPRTEKVILAPEQIPGKRRSSGWGDPPRSKPLVGKQALRAGCGMGADAFEDVAQIGERIDAESFARGDEAGQDRRCPSPLSLP